MAWEEQWGRGRCINCGFLCKRDKHATVSVCYEASAVDRLTGSLTDLGVVTATRPWCFRGKANFQAELSAINAQEHNADKVQELIKSDRQCQFWYPWTEFKTPKEHFEEFQMMQLEQSRRDFEQKMEKDRRDFELQLQELNERERKRSDKIMRWLTIALIIFAIAQVFVALAAFTPDSILFQWFH